MKSDYDLNTSNIDKKTTTKYLLYIISFVIVLIVAAVAVTYGYFKVSTSKTEALSNVNTQTECMNFNYSEKNTINLEYLWPITDEFALKNLTPVTITATNNCTNNEKGMNYTLALTNFAIEAEKNNFLMGDTIRIYVTKKLNTGMGANQVIDVIKPTYLNTLGVLKNGNAADYVNAYLKQLAGVEDLEAAGLLHTNYVIDNASLPNNTTVEYNIYLWVDYYEGDATHTGLNDNKTEGKTFMATISGAINP